MAPIKIKNYYPSFSWTYWRKPLTRHYVQCSDRDLQT